MKNSYYILRHGNSVANQKGLIVSDQYNGITDYGLSDLGRSKLKSDMLKIKERNIFNKQLLILSSPFKRTKESAEIFSSIFDNIEIKYEVNLRERFFGDYNLLSHNYYEEVWKDDYLDSLTSKRGVECVSSVLNRTKELIDSLELEYENKDIILVTHGDTGQILICYLLGIDPKSHREVPHLEQGELRKIL